MFQICRLSAANTAPFEKFHMLVLLMQKYVFLALAYLRPQVLHHSSRLITNPHIQCLQYSNDLSCFKLLIWYFESSILCVMKHLSYFKFTLLVRQKEGQLVLIPYNWDQIKQAHLGKRNESRGARSMMQNTKCWRKLRRFWDCDHQTPSRENHLADLPPPTAAHDMQEWKIGEWGSVSCQGCGSGLLFRQGHLTVKLTPGASPHSLSTVSSRQQFTLTLTELKE